MKILVLGSKGQLGQCLNDQLSHKEYEVVYTTREQIDISDFLATKNKIFKIAPDVIINATAFTEVDKAEEDQEMANMINHLAVANIANISSLLGNWLIHVSTDYVFDGNSDVPYKEHDLTNPQGIYGATKLKGELAIQSTGCKHIIIRTSWVFSEYGNNFLKTMLCLGEERDELSIVGDQFGCPTYAQDIAITVVDILPHLNSNKEIVGIYHYCGDSACSWFEFALEIFKQLNEYYQINVPTLKSVPTEKYPTLAKRPKFSALDNRKLQEKFGIFSSNWKEGITSILKKLM
jgi:dTDP-4-dehydrorhamnose reductase